MEKSGFRDSKAQIAVSLFGSFQLQNSFQPSNLLESICQTLMLKMGNKKQTTKRQPKYVHNDITKMPLNFCSPLWDRRMSLFCSNIQYKKHYLSKYWQQHGHLGFSTRHQTFQVKQCSGWVRWMFKIRHFDVTVVSHLNMHVPFEVQRQEIKWSGK